MRGRNRDIDRGEAEIACTARGVERAELVGGLARRGDEDFLASDLWNFLWRDLGIHDAHELRWAGAAAHVRGQNKRQYPTHYRAVMH